MPRSTRRSFIDKTSLEEIRLIPQLHQSRVDYYWDHYSYFAHQRSLIFDELKNSLIKNIEEYSFEKWVRIVTYKYCLDPLSTRGSVITEGGRFNIGNISQTKFPQFPALYLAENFEIAYKEKFRLYNATKQREGLTSEELSISQSIVSVVLRGYLSNVLNLNSKMVLKDFFELIKSIKLSKNLIKRAKKLNIPPDYEVKNIKQLKTSLLHPNWRIFPMQFGIPANSQIFGQIAHAAGIEAIIYPSRMSDQHKCLAVFPNNFAKASSFIELEDDVEGIKYKRLDSTTYLEFV